MTAVKIFPPAARRTRRLEARGWFRAQGKHFYPSPKISAHARAPGPDGLSLPEPGQSCLLHFWDALNIWPRPAQSLLVCFVLRFSKGGLDTSTLIKNIGTAGASPGGTLSGLKLPCMLIPSPLCFPVQHLCLGGQVTGYCRDPEQSSCVNHCKQRAAARILPFAAIFSPSPRLKTQGRFRLDARTSCQHSGKQSKAPGGIAARTNGRQRRWRWSFSCPSQGGDL